MANAKCSLINGSLIKSDVNLTLKKGQWNIVNKKLQIKKNDGWLKMAD